MWKWIVGIVIGLITIIIIIKIATRKNSDENFGSTLSRIKRKMIDCCIRPLKR